MKRMKINAHRWLRLPQPPWREVMAMLDRADNVLSGLVKRYDRRRKGPITEAEYQQGYNRRATDKPYAVRKA